MSKEFNAFLVACGKKHQCTGPYTPQEDISLKKMARCMARSQALPQNFWLEAIMCTTYVLNTCPTKALQSIALYGA